MKPDLEPANQLELEPFFVKLTSMFPIENVKLRVKPKAVLYILPYIAFSENAGKYLDFSVSFSTM